jgi:hypothetical protein
MHKQWQAPAALIGEEIKKQADGNLIAEIMIQEGSLNPANAGAKKALMELEKK